MRFDYLAVLIPLGVTLALVLIIVINGMPKQNPTAQAVQNTGGLEGKDHHVPEMHTRPICADSAHFKAEVGGKMRGCGWVGHNAMERCAATLGRDNNGNQVYAKDACFDTCGTGNCRRRLRVSMGFVTEEAEELN